MNSKQKILYISQEITPYLPESAMALSCNQIPTKVQEYGYEARAFMPKYGSINERRNQLHEVIRLSGLNLVIDDTDHPLVIKVATLQPAKMQVYFIDSDDYFRNHTSDRLETVTSPADNDERIIFFVRGVMETVKKLRWEPAVIHASGWMSALAPLYLKRAFADDPTIGGAPIVYSLFSDGFDGTLDARFVEKLKLDKFADEELAALGDGDVDIQALNRLAIAHADAVIQASEDASAELLSYAESLGKRVLPWNGGEPSVEDIVELYGSLKQE